MKTHTLLLFAILCTLQPVLHAQQSTLGEGDSYAWAPNLGWVELTPHRPAANDGVRVADTHLSGFAWSDSTGWLNFGDGTPANAIRYSNADGNDSGVNHDGAGNLSGLAWSANLGWINFGWATASDPNRPRFDLYNGGFTGLAWSSNIGWINLGTGILKTDTIIIADSDNDGISDTWERQHSPSRGILTTFTATSDYDHDGISDQDEYLADTDPLSPASRLFVSNMTQTPDGKPAVNLTTSLTWPSSPARLYKIQYSSDLTSWQIAAPGLLTPDSGTQTTRGVTHPITDYLFFRIETLLPLQP